MQPTFFATPAEFRAWLERHHADRRELLVGFYKKSSGRPSITWPESVDEALCFGWIDGVRRSLGEEAYTIRFSLRQARPPSYRRAAIHWVTSAKRPETRERRLQALIEDSAAGCPVKPLTRPA